MQIILDDETLLQIILNDKALLQIILSTDDLGKSV